MNADITPQEYDAFRRFLQEASGILLGDNKQYLVRSRLQRVLNDNHLDSVTALLEKLRRPGSSPLKEAVIDAMTTNETLWFRDHHPFRILQEKLLPEFASRHPGQPLTIWSAACSTGQEPYSVAIVVEEFRRAHPGKLQNVRIVATDISRHVLEVARRGEYEMLAIGRGLSPERQRQFFTRCESGSWKIRPQLRNMVEFRELNLLDRFMPGRFDIIFCRNVLIYFSVELKQDILTRMHAALNPGGYLILGASESLSGLQDLYEMVQCHPGIIYRKK